MPCPCPGDSPEVAAVVEALEEEEEDLVEEDIMVQALEAIILIIITIIAVITVISHGLTLRMAQALGTGMEDRSGL